jgi:catechol 2,3-dioxygenase-like lactoylglutathione lyase family enzyme
VRGVDPREPSDQVVADVAVHVPEASRGHGATRHGCAGIGRGYDSSMSRTQVLPLGNFSVSLAVKDLEASRAFYEKLGFSVFGGDPARDWLILQNGTTTIGLFHGMFDRNMLTFNPGWDSAAQPLPEFTDVRELQRRLRAAGIVPTAEADEAGSGPASFMVVDPDGNPILVDQHV